ncbi:MAG: hypothetical protein OCC49_10325 [Fibrobacterales bacterium]
MKTSKHISLFQLPLLLILYLVSSPLYASGGFFKFTDTPILTIGPNFNLSFGGSEVDFSWGVSAALWYYPKDLAAEALGFSINTGYEFNDINKKYVEFQMGNMVGGLSGGLVWDENNTMGYQGSLWFALMELRIRNLNAQNTITPSHFLHVPIMDYDPYD